MAPSHRRWLSSQAMGLALLMASSSTLPALAASAGAAGTQHQHLLPQEGLLLAEKDKERDDKKKKKQNKKQQSTQRSKSGKEQHRKQSTGSRSTERKPKQKTTNKKASDKKAADKKKHDTKKLSDKERKRIYQQGRKDGLEKGKKKGKDKGYRQAQRQQWKAWNRDQWRYHNANRRNIWVNPVQYNRPFYGNPGWAQHPNWGYKRPWGGGWYNSSSPSWSWWGGQALGWGINALTTALIVNNAVNNAIRQRQPTVMVPNSTMQLYYGSVEPTDETDVTFIVANNGNTFQMEADCADGLLDGEVPTSLAEAELINTACQVAFGSI